jgi:hypothetical protein
VLPQRVVHTLFLTAKMHMLVQGGRPLPAAAEALRCWMLKSIPVFAAAAPA